MRFAITGTDARFLPLRKLLLADGHEITDPASADMVISPPWDPSARYAHLEEYQIANAQLTAEGAVALLRPETGLSGAHVLLLGYGRIARLLARELQKAGALVTAAARSGEQRAWAEAESIEALPLDALSGALDRFDVIIGTIPAPVLTEPLLALVRKDALLLELASAPGGIGCPPRRTRGVFATSARPVCRRNTRRSAPRSFCATRCTPPPRSLSPVSVSPSRGRTARFPARWRRSGL